MFRTLARLINDPGLTNPNAPLSARVFQYHPLQLSRWLDEAWAFSSTITGPLNPLNAFLGDQRIVNALALPAPPAGGALAVPSGLDVNNPRNFTGGAGPSVSALAAPAGFPTTFPLAWRHLLYAYLIESTGAFEIFVEVVRRLVVGETLSTLSIEGQQWLRSTEDLFFSDPPSFSITGITSHVRPDMRVVRRNVYYRELGFELTHPIPPRWTRSTEPQPWRQDTGANVNLSFREKWTELLRQLWLGIENSRNLIGPNATDAAYVALLCQTIRDMLTMRRQGGRLAREEFVHVSTMSWFHLTVSDNFPIIADLNADATNPADRLAKLAQRVGMTPAPRSRELFDLADPASTLLRGIELGLFDTPAGAETLYRLPGPLQQDVNNIIDLWQSATGDRVKDHTVSTQPGRSPAQPIRVPSPPPPVPVPAVLNGARK